MNLGKLGINISRGLSKLIGQEEKINEGIISSFNEHIGGNKGNQLVEKVSSFFKLDIFCKEDKIFCLQYLFQNKLINSDNIDGFLEKFPEFEKHLNSIRPFLEQGELSITKNFVGNEINEIL